MALLCRQAGSVTGGIEVASRAGRIGSPECVPAERRVTPSLHALALVPEARRCSPGTSGPSCRPPHFLWMIPDLG